MLAWSRAIVSANAPRVVAAPLIGLATLGLIGYLANVPRLVQPLQSFPPLRFGSVIGLLLLGVGIVCASMTQLRWLARVCAVLTLGLALLRLLPAGATSWLSSYVATLPEPTGLNWHGQPPSPMAASSALYLFLGGTGLLAILSRPRGMWASIMLATSGGIVMLLATTVIAAQLLGVLEGVSAGPFIGSSLQSSLCAILFSTYFNALVWTKQSGFSAPPSWLPLSVGAGSLTTVLFVWRALIGSEEARLGDQSRAVVVSTRSAVNRQLMVAQRNLRRLARHSRAPDRTWQASVTQMTADVAGLQAVVWADEHGQPIMADSNASDATLQVVARTLKPFAGRFTHEQQWGSFIPVSDSPALSLLVQPRCLPGGCTDLFVAVVDVRRVVTSILADTVLGFVIGVGNDSGWIHTSAPMAPLTARHVETRQIVNGGPNWKIGVWPSQRVADLTPSALSDLVLLLGIAVSVLLAIALRLAQAVSQTARMEERAKLDLALQSRTDGIWEWDIQTGVMTRSAQLWSHLGYSSDENFRTMESWMSLVHPQDRARVEATMGEHLARRTESYDATYRVRSAAGRWHSVVDRGRVVLRSRDGTPLNLLGMFADVTDRWNAEESTRQAETMSTMGRLAGRIAHEINNPLAGIQTSFHLIKDAVPATHPHFKYVAAIEREIERISDVTRQLYETYRPETESSVHSPVQTVVGEAVAFIEQVNRNTGVGVVVELGGLAAVVKLSDSMLRQCVYNLVQNAIEAAPAGSRVTVRGAIDGDDFVLRVADRGPGVPIEIRERIFEPRVSTKPSKLSTGGMGMGLALVRRALDASGGSIQVTDVDGGGAEFVARIPLAEISLQGVMA